MRRILGTPDTGQCLRRALRPASDGENGYRYYGRGELLRLQQILIHRELGIRLVESGAILDAPDFDRLEVLKSQRDRVAGEVARSAERLRTIDRTIAELEGDHARKDAESYSGIVDAQKQADYEAWLEQQLGPEIRDHVERSRKNGVFDRGRERRLDVQLEGHRARTGRRVAQQRRQRPNRLVH